jgi:MarR family transcriptional regulator, organic hydroperoxide resistance regulator
MSEQLKLENQICFPFYAISRKIVQLYTPYLNELNITYPQYLVLLILWEKDNILVKEICKKLWLETNTVSPLLKTLHGK